MDADTALEVSSETVCVGLVSFKMDGAGLTVSITPAAASAGELLGVVLMADEFAELETVPACWTKADAGAPIRAVFVCGAVPKPFSRPGVQILPILC